MPTLAGITLNDDDPRPDAARLIARAQRAEDDGFDFVVVEPGPADAALAAAAIAARTRRIAVFVRIATATSEPFHVSTQLATIDYVSHGRAGWLVDAAPESERTVTWPPPADPVADAREHIEVVRALWDSWEHGAEIRDAATARYLDRERVHHVDFRGEHIAVRGPSITPRPPQGHPVVAAEAATAALLGDAVDVVIETPAPGEQPGPDARAVLVGDDDAALASGLDGTLRERLGLPAATNRYAGAR